MTPAPPPEVKEAFQSIAPLARSVLLKTRTRIFHLAKIAGVGPLRETLKWGQPAYLTEETRAGSTIRLGVLNGEPVAFFTCSSSLVDGFRADFPDAMTYHGNRAVTLCQPFAPELDICLTRALTYQRRKTAS